MTVKQQQCLLCYLGFYNGLIDGKYGAGTKAAAAKFQKRYGLEPDGIIGTKSEPVLLDAVTGKVQPIDFWSSIKYFKKEEFKCKCGCGADDIEEELVRVAERIREHFGKPITVSSGVRCAKHNKKVGGVSNSRHLKGSAMDFSVSGVPSSTVLAYVKKQPEIRYTYAINKDYVHMDIG